MSTPSRIEPVTSVDYPEIMEVWEASVRATHDFLREEDILFFKPLILKDYLKAVNLVCIRNEEGKIAGFLGTSNDKIEMLFIHPASRGKNIGKELLNHAIYTLNIRKVDVNEQNTQAVGFYEHMGFRTIGRTELDGLGKPYPILFMELDKAES